MSDELNIVVKKDGDSFVATWSDFVNLQESCTGFGYTPQEAVIELIKESGWRGGDGNIQG